MHVHNDMRVKFIKELLDIPCLLASKLDVIAIGVEVAGQRALEVENAIRIIARQHHKLEIIENRACPLCVIIELAKEGLGGLVAGGLVAVNGSLDPDTDFRGAFAPRTGIASR
jgi:hypothetical protein